MDVVVNSLSGRFTQETLKLLAPFGRFVEIGKHDIMNGAVAPMKQFLNNCTYRVFDLDRWWKTKNEYIDRTKEMQRAADGKNEAYNSTLQRRILKSNDFLTVTERFAKEFKEKKWVLPTEAFEAHDITMAFEKMMKGRHIGKMCVRFPPACPHAQCEVPSSITPTADSPFVVYENSASPPNIFAQNETYVLVGGTRGLGLEIAFIMALQMKNACHICLVSRSGGKTSNDLKRKLQLLKWYVPHKTV